jgi:hypothetical protein
MPASLRMETRRRFGAGAQARLNRDLLGAVKESAASCETCLEISKDLDADAEGADFTEAPSFPGSTVDKLDAHFRFHWKDGYERVGR